MGKAKNTKNEALRERVAETFSVSKEIVLDAARLVFLGDRELTIENYKSIAEYRDNKIIIETNPHRLVITGVGLELKSIAKELLFIEGKIASVEFRREV